jgi:hypothetical protein
MSEAFKPALVIDDRLVQARSGQTFANVDPYREMEIGQTPDAWWRLRRGRRVESS